jgi:hypothetical protein
MTDLFCPFGEHKGAEVPAKNYLIRVYDKTKQTELSTGVGFVVCDEHWNDIKRTLVLGYGAREVVRP